MPKKKAEAPEEKMRPGIVYALPIVIAFVLVYGYMFSGFRQIPGPMYGGDYYFHYGIAKHIANGNMPWTCPQVAGEWAFYPWLLHLSVALMGWATGDLLGSFILYFPLVVVFLSGVVWYLLGKEVFGDERFALLTCLGWLATRPAVGYIPANFTPMVTVPLFLFLTLKAVKLKQTKWVAAAGVSFGLLIMSHASALPAAGFFLFVLFTYKVLLKNAGFRIDSDNMRINLSLKGEKMKKSLKEEGRIYLGIFVVGFMIGLLYWAPILYIYHFNYKNPWNDYTMPDFQVYGGTIFADFFIRQLFNYPAALAGQPQLFMASILTLTGLAWAAKKRDIGGTYISLAFISGVLGFMHYLITTPLFNVNYAPVRFESFMVIPAALLLAVYGISCICSLLKKGTQRNAFIAFGFILFIASAAVRIEAQYNDIWSRQGRMTQNPAVLELASWVEQNTDRNAVFLSHEELAFALNGLTARKVVAERRTHFNPYVDLDERLADSMVILYGNDSNKSLELLRKYNVSYLYWDVNYLSFSQRTPSLVRQKYGEYLAQYGVRYQLVNAYLDPAYELSWKKYDVLMVYPAKEDWRQPWGDELQKHLKLVEDVEMQLQSNGQAFIGPGYRIYEIDYGSF